MRSHSLAFIAAIGTGFLIAGSSCTNTRSHVLETVPSTSDLCFPSLANRWDEAIPLGNSTVGALVWQNDSALRFSLDRVDLWDLRPMDNLAGANYSFKWVLSKIAEGDYGPVQQKFDDPYIINPAPSKIPGAALEFIGLNGNSDSIRLYINNALCEARWDNGVTLKTFVSANQPLGWFMFEHLTDSIVPELREPAYFIEKINDSNDHAGPSLQRLGYKQGTKVSAPGLIDYHQPGFGDDSYDVAVRWVQSDSTLIGVWSVTSSSVPEKASDICTRALERGIEADYSDHIGFWDNFWAQSSISIPDPVLQKQYDNEMYKFGSVAREHSYPISLQAVWTADNGSLPPWKGDYHHDLNTQLSYWPSYTGNHLTEAMGYINTLWNQRDTYRDFTKQYFGTEGLNVPGVCTLTGQPMGGWIQYSMSPTCGAWLAHHFYLQWVYSADKDFLADKAYPFVRDVATYLEQLSFIDDDGKRKLPASSSPEVNDNSISAWFKSLTNYDNALMTSLFGHAAEMADSLGLHEESAHWHTLKASMPQLDTDEENVLTIAKGHPYRQSHRHFSHAMAIFPLGILDVAQGAEDAEIVKSTIKRLTDVGPDWWCGYSYSWLGNLQARALNGDGAADALRIFAECFCLPNTFHVNGDQTNTGKSKFTYRPFTLEGNFAFAAGVQEMLLQSHRNMIEVFPAIPSNWRDVSFTDLRGRGAFLVSATMVDGAVSQISIKSEKGGTLRLLLPDKDMIVDCVSKHSITPECVFTTETSPGQTISLRRR